MTYDGVTDFSLNNGQPHETLCDQAQAFVRAGIPIFPVFNAVETKGLVTCSCGKGAGSEDGHKPGKHPATPRGHHDAALLSDVEIAGWFLDGTKGLAYPTGNGIIVIDVDPKNNGIETLESWDEWTQGVSLPETLRVKTGSGGLHLIYSLPIGARVPKRDGILPGIDLKSDGGYCVAAGSRHISGNLYTWDNPGHPITVVPADLLNWMLTQRGSFHPGGTADGAGRVEGQGIHAGLVIGNRDTYFHDRSFKMRREGVSRERATEVLHRVWLELEQPPGDFFAWETVLEKIERHWTTVATDVTADQSEAAQRMLTGRHVGPEQSGTGPVNDAPGMTGGSGPRPEGSPGPALEGEVVPPAVLTQHPTDMGNSVRYVKLLGDKVRYVPEEGRWYVWDGNRLRIDTVRETLALTRRVIDDLRDETLTMEPGNDRDRMAAWARSSESYARRTAMLAGAELEQGVALGVDILDKDPLLLVMENGTLDLRHGQLRPSRINDLCTKQAAVSFDVDAECPLWLAHVDLITAGDKDLAAYLQRACGYSLTGLVSEQKFFFLWGAGQNGKNVFTETILGLMGEYAQVAPMGLITGGDGDHPTILAGLRGARMVMSDETGTGKRMNDARIKMLTGSAKISARMMKKDFFEFDASLKLWILGNAKPTIKDTSTGMWRRMQLVPFINQIPDGKRILRYEEQLRSEWPGILNWCLEGLKSWQELGSLGAPAAVTGAVDNYRKEEDYFGQFLLDCTERCDGDGSVMGSAYLAYQFWCATNGITKNDQLNNIHFSRELTTRGFPRIRRKVDGKTTTIIIGLSVVVSLAGGQ